MGVSLYNHERYLDPTAYEALSNIEREKKKQSQSGTVETKKTKEQNMVNRSFSTEYEVIGGVKR